MHSKRSEQNTT